MKCILAAYTTAPSSSCWNPDLETQYFEQLKAMDNLRGIEHPFVGSLHPYSDEWFLSNIDPEWDFIFTCMPGVMQRITHNPEFGLASDEEDGRQAALDFYDQARLAVIKLNNYLNRQAVRSIQLHTAPNRLTATSSSAQALQGSLETLQSWHWDGAQLIVEHCDAYIEGQRPEKGFLTMDEEIEAIVAVNSSTGGDIGLAINWGRSALEARGTHGPLDHISKAKNANLLKGLMFSGVSATDTAYGVWKDTHMPPAQAFSNTYYAEGSLLTVTEFQKALDASDYQKLDFLGLKIALAPNDRPVEERVAYNRDALSILQELTG